MKQHWLHPILTAYVIFLLMAALPLKATQMLLSTIQDFSIKSLTMIAVVPGQKLFYRPFNEAQKVRGDCIMVFGQAENGRPYFLGGTERFCGPEKRIQFFADASEIMIFRMLEAAALFRAEGFAGSSKNPYSPEFKMRPKEKAVYAAIGDFYCRSKHARSPEDRPNYVYVYWEQRRIDYHTGFRSSMPALFMKWKCETQQVLFAEWAPFVDKARLDRFLDAER
jgi:hypothetical protein